jgi:hypothetical protein
MLPTDQKSDLQSDMSNSLLKTQTFAGLHESANPNSFQFTSTATGACQTQQTIDMEDQSQNSKFVFSFQSSPCDPNESFSKVSQLCAQQQERNTQRTFCALDITS